MYTYRVIKIGDKYALQRRLFGVLNLGCLDLLALELGVEMWWGIKSKYLTDILADTIDDIRAVYDRITLNYTVVQGLN